MVDAGMFWRIRITHNKNQRDGGTFFLYGSAAQILLCLSKLFFLQYQYSQKVLSLKEEGGSYAINQGYDKEVATRNKKEQRDALVNLLHAKHIMQGIVDHWEFIYAGLVYVLKTKRCPWIWVN